MVREALLLVWCDGVMVWTMEGVCACGTKLTFVTTLPWKQHQLCGASELNFCVSTLSASKLFHEDAMFAADMHDGEHGRWLGDGNLEP